MPMLRQNDTQLQQVVKSNLTKGRIAAAHQRFSRIRQVTPHFWSTWFLGPIGVHSPNGISIGSVGFAGLTIVTDRQTSSVTIGHICVLRCDLKTTGTS